MSTRKNRTLEQAADLKLIDGLTKHATTLSTLLIGNTPFTPADLIAIVQPQVTAANTTQSTKAIWQNAVKAERDERAKNKPLISVLKQTLQLRFAGAIDTLADFGLSPRKPRVVTPEKRAAAAAKAKATRAARHTMGKKQRKGVMGAVTGILVTPLTATTTPIATAPSSPNAPAVGTGATATPTPRAT